MKLFIEGDFVEYKRAFAQTTHHVCGGKWKCPTTYVATVERLDGARIFLQFVVSVCLRVRVVNREERGKWNSGWSKYYWSTRYPGANITRGWFKDCFIHKQTHTCKFYECSQAECWRETLPPTLVPKIDSCESSRYRLRLDHTGDAARGIIVSPCRDA